MANVIGFFHHYDEAEKAVKALEDGGVDSGRIGVIPQESDPTRDVSDHPVLGKMKSVTGKYLVSVKTGSSEEERIVKDILSGVGATHLESDGETGPTDATSGYLRGPNSSSG